MLEVSRKGLSVPLTSWWSRLRTTGACGVQGHERSAAVSTAWPGAEFKGQATSDALWPTLGSSPSAGGRRGFQRPSPPVTAQRCPFCPPRARAPPGAGSESPLPCPQSPRPPYGAPVSALQGQAGALALIRGRRSCPALHQAGPDPALHGTPRPVRWRRGHSRLRLQHGAQS